MGEYPVTIGGLKALIRDHAWFVKHILVYSLFPGTFGVRVDTPWYMFVFTLGIYQLVLRRRFRRLIESWKPAGMLASLEVF